MNLQDTQTIHTAGVGTPTRRLPARWLFLARVLWRIVAIYLMMLLAGGSTLPPRETITRRLAMVAAGHGFDVMSWQVNALAEKTDAFFRRPARALDAPEQAALVQAYLTRARRIQELGHEINGLLSASDGARTGAVAALQLEIDALRAQQQLDRSTVEQIIEEQVGAILAAEGLAWGDKPLPPVKFSFVEPPKKLVVSPRERIETLFGYMVDAAMTLEEVEQAEQTIRTEHGLSGYITGIGGLGAYPTMVIDNAGLPWILSTVAHEWVHNYLTFFPLGFNYGVNSENFTINETVAEGVGVEIGEAAVRRFCPQLAPPPTPPADMAEFEAGGSELQGEGEDESPPVFDFGAEMRITRLRVDELLTADRIDEAERYMEQRRLLFVEQGYPLRVLNQAYFAFHGSYGTGPASTSPLGPKLERLRQLTPNVKTYLQVVRSLLTPEDVDRALAEWEP